MIQKKICLMGSFAVGKTSLVRRFVENMFSDKYLTTLGVKISKKIVNIRMEDVTILIWDIGGEDLFPQTKLTYLRGMSGYLLVVDKTRASTLEIVIDIQKKVRGTFPNVPCILLVNKTDLNGQWDIEDLTIEKLRHEGWDIMKTSAKTGLGVEEAFTCLAAKMLEKTIT